MNLLRQKQLVAVEDREHDFSHHVQLQLHVIDCELEKKLMR